jgi:hypothetical protein
MSEWVLKKSQDFPTSKLNTRVRFPSPAPRFSTPRYDLVRFGALLSARLLAADFPETRTVLDHWFVLLIFWSWAADPGPMQNPLVGGRRRRGSADIARPPLI